MPCQSAPWRSLSSSTSSAAARRPLKARVWQIERTVKTVARALAVAAAPRPTITETLSGAAVAAAWRPANTLSECGNAKRALQGRQPSQVTPGRPRRACAMWRSLLFRPPIARSRTPYRIRLAAWHLELLYPLRRPRARCSDEGPAATAAEKLGAVSSEFQSLFSSLHNSANLDYKLAL